MDSKSLLEITKFAVIFFSLSTLCALLWRKEMREYFFLAAFAAITAFSDTITVAVLFFRRYTGLDRAAAYKVYLYSGWVTFVVEYALLMMAIYFIFRLAMRPFEGLHKVGKLVFRWVCGVSLIVGVGVAIGPHIGQGFWASFDGQVHQAIGILALCLLLFVTFATRFLGLTYRSRIFGVTLGFGVWATTSLIESALLSAKSATVTVYSPVYLWETVGVCLSMSIWAVYFALPEPQRQLITLPTTSPFFTWNRISEALGDDPGHVVVGGMTPDMLAPGELHVLTAASRSGRARSNRETAPANAPRLQSVAAQG